MDELDIAARSSRGDAPAQWSIAHVVPRLGLALVADSRAEPASAAVDGKAAIETFISTFDRLGGPGTSVQDAADHLLLAFNAYERTSSGAPLGALTGVVHAHGRLLVAGVGDSRCYGLGAHGLELVNRMQSAPVASLAVSECAPGTVYALCSSGVWTSIHDTKLVAILQRSATAQEACDLLIDAARAAGAGADVAVAVVRSVPSLAWVPVEDQHNQDERSATWL